MSYPDPDVAVQVKVSHPDPEFAAQTKLPHSEDSAVVAQTSSSQQSSYNQEPQAPPYSSQVPETVTEEIQHLKESNELGSLKKTNESMGEEIAELRQKMRDFESKVRARAKSRCSTIGTMSCSNKL